MRLLVVNSNSSDSITALLRREALALAGPGTQVTAVTCTGGPPAIETPGDVAAAALATRDALLGRDGAGEPDAAVGAAIIACFSDPGLMEIRRDAPFPVVGLAEAAMFTACLLGARFSIVTVAPRSVPGIRAVAESYGLGGRLAGIHALDRGVLASHADPAATARDLAALARAAVARDGSEVIVLGGAITAGMGRSLSRDLSVPVVDGLAAAMTMARGLCEGGYRRG